MGIHTEVSIRHKPKNRQKSLPSDNPPDVELEGKTRAVALKGTQDIYVRLSTVLYYGMVEDSFESHVEIPFFLLTLRALSFVFAPTTGGSS